MDEMEVCIHVRTRGRTVCMRNSKQFELVTFIEPFSTTEHNIDTVRKYSH